MSIFKKSKEEKKEPVCSCQCNGSDLGKGENQEGVSSCRNDSQDKISYIKVLGAGCASCHKMYENTKEAVKNMGLNVDVEYITDMQKVMEYGVMSIPALVLNDKVVSVGKVLKVNDIEKILGK